MPSKLEKSACRSISDGCELRKIKDQNQKNTCKCSVNKTPVIHSFKLDLEMAMDGPVMNECNVFIIILPPNIK